MKKLLALSACMMAFTYAGFAQGTSCSQTGSFTSATNNTTLDNRTNTSAGCVQFRLTYFSTGFSALSIAVQSAPDVAGAPGAWVDITGSSIVTQGSNPSTDLSSEIVISNYYPWVRVNVSTVTGSGTIRYALNGVNATIANSKGGGGGRIYAGVSPIVVTGPNISCPTCDTSAPPVTSVFGRIGAVVAATNDYNTDQVTQGSVNKYYSDTLARLALTASAPLVYNNSTGAFTCPTCNTSASNVTSVFGRTGAVTAATNDYNTSQVNEVTNLYYTDARARLALSATSPIVYNNTTGGFTCPTCSVGASTITYGAIASRPSAGTAGAVYIPSDSFYGLLFDTGAAWNYHCLDGQTCTPPIAANFTAVNSPVISSQTNGATTVSSAAASGDNIRSWVLSSYPTPPFTRTFRLKPLVFPIGTTQIGVVFRESGTGKIITFDYKHSTQPQLAVDRYTNATTFSAQSFATGLAGIVMPWLPSIYLTMRVSDAGSGGNLTYSISTDGVNFLQLFTEARNAFFTTGPDQVGVFANSNNATWAALVNFVAID